MTTIACGGGPSIDQRRDFAGLRDGAHVPGYRGYCPQLKYSLGKTYGRDTLELAKSYEHRHPLTSSLEPQAPRPPLKNRLPESTGDNKYTKNMVPGYTGYIPRWPFKFGNTYKEDCDVCIDEHLSNSVHHASKDQVLRQAARTQTRLQPIAQDPTVRNHLNTYRDTHPNRPIMMEDKRGATEPPIPGYQGYVPRIHTTELGLGCRYHQMTKNGLEAFQGEQDFHRASQSAPISINRVPGAVDRTAARYSKRLYLQDGMIPKYTGYLPQRRFNFGNTYGDTTRSLDVCAHKNTSFGEFMQTRNTLNSALC